MAFTGRDIWDLPIIIQMGISRNAGLSHFLSFNPESQDWVKFSCLLTYRHFISANYELSIRCHGDLSSSSLQKRIH